MIYIRPSVLFEQTTGLILREACLKRSFRAHRHDCIFPRPISTGPQIITCGHQANGGQSRPKMTQQCIPWLSSVFQVAWSEGYGCGCQNDNIKEQSCIFWGPSWSSSCHHDGGGLKLPCHLFAIGTCVFTLSLASAELPRVQAWITSVLTVPIVLAPG